MDWMGLTWSGGTRMNGLDGIDTEWWDADEWIGWNDTEWWDTDEWIGWD